MNHLDQKKSLEDLLNEDIDSRQVFGFGRSPRSRPSRRSLSGATLPSLLETKFMHFKAFQRARNDSKGLNCLLAPSSGPLYRSSLPVTPISTPSTNRGLTFTERSLQNRILMQSQLPHQSSDYSPINHQSCIEEANESQQDGLKLGRQHSDRMIVRLSDNSNNIDDKSEQLEANSVENSHPSSPATSPHSINPEPSNLTEEAPVKRNRSRRLRRRNR